MLGLPPSTEVNRRVSKEKLFANMVLSTQVRDIIKEQIEAVFWRNKLANSTFNVSAGEIVNELQVFEVQLRQKGLDKRVLSVISRAIPYKILFVLTFEAEAQVWIEASGTFYNTKWLPLNELALRFDGLNLDVIYENLVRQLASGRLDTGIDIAEAVDRARRRQRLEREIAALERKVLQEKQFNRQVELNGELKRLKEKMGGLS